MKTAIVIQHLDFEDLGNLETVLINNDYEITTLHATELPNIDFVQPDMLVVLGGPIGAYQEELYPFLRKELDIIAYRIQNKLPLIGICLGAQLIARLLGAKVYPGHDKEIGWSKLTFGKADNDNILKDIISSNHPVLHWHGDTFDLPPGAKHLASSTVYENQAFSVGNYCLGLQFHLEVTKEGMERWFIGHAHEISHTPGVSVDQLQQDTAKYAASLNQKATHLWQQWLDQLPPNKH